MGANLGPVPQPPVPVQGSEDMFSLHLRASSSEEELCTKVKQMKERDGHADVDERGREQIDEFLEGAFNVHVATAKKTADSDDGRTEQLPTTLELE